MKEQKNEEGQKMINNYIFMGTLGKGSFGKVKLAYKEVDGKKKKFGIKVMKKSYLMKKKAFIRGVDGKMHIKTALEDVQREIAIMK